jgi:glutathione S-transferase
VLRTENNAVLTERPLLAAYVARATARPAFQRALAAQLAALD